MTEKELRKCSKADLMEMLMFKQREADSLRAELEEEKKKQKDMHLKLSRVGSLAEASLALTNVFEEAQRAADNYLESVRKLAGAPAKSEKERGE